MAKENRGAPDARAIINAIATGDTKTINQASPEQLLETEVGATETAPRLSTLEYAVIRHTLTNTSIEPILAILTQKLFASKTAFSGLLSTEKLLIAHNGLSHPKASPRLARSLQIILQNLPPQHLESFSKEIECLSQRLRNPTELNTIKNEILNRQQATKPTEPRTPAGPTTEKKQTSHRDPSTDKKREDLMNFLILKATTLSTEVKTSPSAFVETAKLWKEVDSYEIAPNSGLTKLHILACGAALTNLLEYSAEAQKTACQKNLCVWIKKTNSRLATKALLAEDKEEIQRAISRAEQLTKYQHNPQFWTQINTTLTSLQQSRNDAQLREKLKLQLGLLGEPTKGTITTENTTTLNAARQLLAELEQETKAPDDIDEALALCTTPSASVTTDTTTRMCALFDQINNRTDLTSLKRFDVMSRMLGFLITNFETITPELQARTPRRNLIKHFNNAIAEWHTAINAEEMSKDEESALRQELQTVIDKNLAALQKPTRNLWDEIKSGSHATLTAEQGETRTAATKPEQKQKKTKTPEKQLKQNCFALSKKTPPFSDEEISKLKQQLIEVMGRKQPLTVWLQSNEFPAFYFAVNFCWEHTPSEEKAAFAEQMQQYTQETNDDEGYKILELPNVPAEYRTSVQTIIDAMPQAKELKQKAEQEKAQKKEAQKKEKETEQKRKEEIRATAATSGMAVVDPKTGLAKEVVTIATVHAAAQEEEAAEAERARLSGLQVACIPTHALPTAAEMIATLREQLAQEQRKIATLTETIQQRQSTFYDRALEFSDEAKRAIQQALECLRTRTDLELSIRIEDLNKKIMDPNASREALNTRWKDRYDDQEKKFKDSANQAQQQHAATMGRLLEEKNALLKRLRSVPASSPLASSPDEEKNQVVVHTAPPQRPHPIVTPSEEIQNLKQALLRASSEIEELRKRMETQEKELTRRARTFTETFTRQAHEVTTLLATHAYNPSVLTEQLPPKLNLMINAQDPGYTDLDKLWAQKYNAAAEEFETRSKEAAQKHSMELTRALEENKALQQKIETAEAALKKTSPKAELTQTHEENKALQQKIEATKAPKRDVACIPTHALPTAAETIATLREQLTKAQEKIATLTKTIQQQQLTFYERALEFSDEAKRAIQQALEYLRTRTDLELSIRIEDLNKKIMDPNASREALNTRWKARYDDQERKFKDSANQAQQQHAATMGRLLEEKNALLKRLRSVPASSPLASSPDEEKNQVVVHTAPPQRPHPIVTPSEEIQNLKQALLRASSEIEELRKRMETQEKELTRRARTFTETFTRQAHEVTTLLATHAQNPSVLTEQLPPKLNLMINAQDPGYTDLDKLWAQKYNAATEEFKTRAKEAAQKRSMELTRALEENKALQQKIKTAKAPKRDVETKDAATSTSSVGEPTFQRLYQESVGLHREAERAKTALQRQIEAMQREMDQLRETQGHLLRKITTAYSDGRADGVADARREMALQKAGRLATPPLTRPSPAISTPVQNEKTSAPAHSTQHHEPEQKQKTQLVIAGRNTHARHTLPATGRPSTRHLPHKAQQAQPPVPQEQEHYSSPAALRELMGIDPKPKRQWRRKDSHISNTKGADPHSHHAPGPGNR